MYYSPVISAVVTFGVIIALIRNRSGKLVDMPNERSLHTVPTPRTGGIALVAGIFLGWLFLIQSWAWWIVVPTVGLFVLSLIDDMRSLSPRTRLIGHFAAALLALIGAGINWLWFLPVLLYIVWMTNLYNFMDGSDGLAGGMAFSGFGFYGFAGLMGGDSVFAVLNFAVAAAALGFLFHNFPPAKIFMGDAGSIPLGFLAATFGVMGWQKGYWPMWFPALVFSPFVVDATVTLYKRTRRGEKLTQAHRSHYYQRLVQMGWGHRNTAMAEYVLMLASGATALYGINLPPMSIILMLSGWGVAYAVLMVEVDRRWRSVETQHAIHDCEE